jgi:adenosylcobinamide-GDP ribazoletransferase
MFAGFIGALGFLSVLPIGKNTRWTGAMLLWFWPVGLLLGVLWSLADHAMGWVFPPLLRSGLDVLVLAIMTGGLHLDGLADAADGLLCHRGRSESLRIMRDSFIGTWGVLALVFLLGLKMMALAQIAVDQRLIVLALVPAYGRLASQIAMAFLPYLRGEDGIAHHLFTPLARWAWCPGVLVLPGIMAWICRDILIFWNVTFGIWVALVLLYYRLRMKGVTGDMLGALIESTELVLLMVVVGRI